MSDQSGQSEQSGQSGRGGPSGPSEQGGKDILGHLQAAAKELIQAGRGILDAADEVISDRLRLLNKLVGDQPSAKTGERLPVEKIDVEVETDD